MEFFKKSKKEDREEEFRKKKEKCNFFRRDGMCALCEAYMGCQECDMENCIFMKILKILNSQKGER